MITRSQDDLLYFNLVSDLTNLLNLKVQLNHNMELVLQMQGRMGEAFCYAIHIVGEGIDMMMFFYMLDIAFIQLGSMS